MKNGTKNALLTCCLGLAALLSGSTAFADDSITVNLSVHKVLVRNGAEVYESGDRALPGNTLEYRAVYKNVTKAPLKNVVATLPIPNTGLAYIAESALPRTAMASVDGVKYAPIPLTRTVMLPSGQLITQMVPVSEYRFLRWQVGDLAAGASVTVKARAHVDDQPTFVNR